ncbi:MAG: SH3 domain-containing protein [Rhodobacter sp.]|nr:SH3 domain-containing protein [Rhodobacter sp.]
MIIRLTLLTTAAIAGAMLVFGTDDGSVAVEEIAEAVLEETAPMPAAAPVETAAVETAKAEDVTQGAIQAAVQEEVPGLASEVEVAKQEALDLTGVLPTSTQVDVAVATAIAETPVEAEPRAGTVTSAAPEPEPEPRIVYVTGSRVNMRAGPSTSNPVVDRLVRGTAAEVLGEAGDGWLQIRDIATGTEGFMSGDFLSPANPG